MSGAADLWSAAPDWRAWRHVTKLDPDRSLADEALDRVLAAGTDALILGGSAGVTRQKTLDLWDRIRAAGCRLPIVLELTAAELAVPGLDLYWVPSVLNTDRGEWVFGQQARAMTAMLDQYGAFIPWHLLLPAPYVVLNPDCTAARLTGARTCTRAEAVGYGGLARLWGMPFLYLEYSGSYGEVETVQAVRAAASETHLIYGGGIDSGERAAAMARHADTVVVGNLVYRTPAALAETVAAVRATVRM